MANETDTMAPQKGSRANAASLKQYVLLAPEGAAIAVLLGLYTVTGAPTAIALLTGLVLVSLLVRFAALMMARHALDSYEYREAELYLGLAMALFPWSPDALALRGALLMAQGEADEAEQHLRRAVALAPRQPSYALALSNTLLEQGRADEAGAVAAMALDLDATSGAPYLVLAEAARAADATPDRVEAYLREGLTVATQPDIQAALQCALAATLMEQRRLAEASLALHGGEALLAECSPGRQSELRLYLAEILTALGHPEQAKEHAGNVTHLHRQMTPAWRSARS